MSYTKIYRIWQDMVRRCTYPNHARFADYGGRGITVCERWMTFESFFADMGERPRGRSLDRQDNDAGYSPENCRWATPQEQRQNRRPMAVRQTCAAGHPHSPENTRIDRQGKRRCRTCERLWAAMARARKKALV
ncbi:hypothetical protein [Micromonospora sp. CA-248212]|uniref:hypothetical protein n=1 Tax=Micromonospora sp. CA-248212 TaxID=3239961 RepID=UPI003D8B4305